MLPPESIPQKPTPSQQTPESGPLTQVETQDIECLPTEQAQELVAELKQHIDPALQICRYLLEMFSVPLLRSHANASLVDRDRLQLYHANRSVILVSSAIDFAKEEREGKDKFIATIIAFHCLTFAQNGIITSDFLVKQDWFGEDKVVQNGNKLHFLDSENKGLEVILEDVISREPAVIGRSTVVLNARVKGEYWKTRPLIVKVSWPTSGRVSETKFIKKARKEAVDNHQWAVDHLPKVYRARDVIPTQDSIPNSVAGMFEGAKFLDTRSFVYERRVLRIIVQERLVPLRYLSSVRDIGQVFLDVACGTCDGFRFWLGFR